MQKLAKNRFPQIIQLALTMTNYHTSASNSERVSLPLFLFWLGGSIRATFSVLVGDIAALLVRCTLVLKNMSDAELKALKAWL